MQIFGVVKELMNHHPHTYGLIMGGTNRQEEAKKIAKGVNLIVATPGRLFTYINNICRSNNCIMLSIDC